MGMIREEPCATGCGTVIEMGMASQAFDQPVCDDCVGDAISCKGMGVSPEPVATFDLSKAVDDALEVRFEERMKLLEKKFEEKYESIELTSLSVMRYVQQIQLQCHEIEAKVTRLNAIVLPARLVDTVPTHDNLFGDAE